MSLSDLDQTFGGDISVNNTHDLLLASGVTLCQERILRRLLTNPGDYIWQPSYGAGLRQYVGSVGKINEIVRVIKTQMALEPGVSNPQPAVTYLQNGLSVTITFTDTQTQQPTILSFEVNQ